MPTALCKTPWAAVIQRKQRDAAGLRREAGQLRQRVAVLQAANAGRKQWSLVV